jgi:hypothetical protein
MLRRFLFFGITALALVWTIGLPGRANAHHGRGGSYSGYYHRYDSGQSRPSYGGPSYDEAERNFSARRFNRGVGGFFRRGSGGRSNAGSSEPQFYIGL